MVLYILIHEYLQFHKFLTIIVREAYNIQHTSAGRLVVTDDRVGKGSSSYCIDKVF
jgi:hypothetical protein